MSSFSGNTLRNIRWTSSEPGLTKQRNVAVKMADFRANIIHFLDDDVIVHKDYFAELAKAFAGNPDAVGIGGRIINLPEIKRWKVIRSERREGTVGRAGVNHLSRTPGKGARDVHWLSGCSMSFRASVFEHVCFDERRSGNGVGEDVDFCLRASTYGRILWVPSAMLEHHQSPVNRDGARKSGFSTIDHRLLLARDRLHTVRRSWVLAHGYVESFRRISKSFVTGSESQREYALGMLERLGRGSDD